MDKRRIKGMRFEKIGFDEFFSSMKNSLENGNLDKAIDIPKDNTLDEYIEQIYNNIVLPKRSTIGSAGYDFKFPVDLYLPKDIIVHLPTGICWCSGGSENGLCLNIYPRSSLGIKYSIREPNLVSIIDEDYYGCKHNGGHIYIHLKNEGEHDICFIKAGNAYSQGLVTSYYITEDDNTTNIREGGIGSTTK